MGNRHVCEEKKRPLASRFHHPAEFENTPERRGVAGTLCDEGVAATRAIATHFKGTDLAGIPSVVQAPLHDPDVIIGQGGQKQRRLGRWRSRHFWQACCGNAIL